MLLIGLKNATEQAVPAGGIINLGTVYRKYCKKCNGVKTFDATSQSVSLQKAGMYQVTATVTFSAPVAGDVTIELYENGLPTGALATETITTADTEIRSVAIDYIVLTDEGCLLNQLTTLIDVLSLVNTSDIVATITNVVFDVIKVI